MYGYAIKENIKYEIYFTPCTKMILTEVTYFSKICQCTKFHIPSLNGSLCPTSEVFRATIPHFMKFGHSVKKSWRGGTDIPHLCLSVYSNLIHP